MLDLVPPYTGKVTDKPPNSARKGHWQQTYTGRAYWPADPYADEVDIRDIAHALAYQCRYGGHCEDFYSVAEHSVMCSRMVPPEHALQALLHDATEAYVVDVPRPVKKMLGKAYEDLELVNWLVICARFKVNSILAPSVKLADEIALHTEAKYLMKKPPMAWDCTLAITPANWVPMCLAPHVAERVFLNRFEEITGNGNATRKSGSIWD